MNSNLDFEKLGNNIKDLVYDYIKVESFTGTSNERLVEPFFLSLFKDMEYFKKNPTHVGLYKLENDHLDRAVCYAMVKGLGNDTVVLVHHYDVVDVEDFKGLKNYAFSPDDLRKKLLENIDMLPEDGKADLLSGEFIFGRGGCDMKGGGSIQISLVQEYSKIKDFKGNVIVIGVPDEEILSGGMRGAAKLLSKFKEEYNLNYMMMINSEPHQRKDPRVGVFSEGTVGKMMPFVYVRGFLSHAGKVFEGLNPVNLLSEIVRRTEVNMDFADIVANESAPPPTWLYVKDSKTHYDVSMPLSAFGCLSVLTLNQYPKQLMEKIRGLCEEAFDTVLSDMNRNFGKFLTATGRDIIPLPWKNIVVDFGELYNEAKESYGDKFIAAYEVGFNNILEEAKQKNLTMIEMNYKLIELVYDYIDDISPRIVIGLVPPYYPNVSNYFLNNINDKAKNFSEKLNEYTLEKFNQQYVKEYFYTGICDLSYINIKEEEEITLALEETMPLFGEYYSIPFNAIKMISMPGINIGPWGKDFHKISERVSEEDLCIRTPKILDFAIRSLLK